MTGRPVSLARDLRSGRFWTRLVTHFFAALGLLSAVIGIVSALFPTLLPPKGNLFVAVVVALSGGWALFRSWPRPVQQSYNQPNIEIRVVVGDLFEQEGNIVIGMSTTFDTSTPHVIASSSVQGQLLTKVYNSDAQALDAALAKALSCSQPSGSFKPGDNKRGKQTTYPLGTVAAINQSPRKLYFCVAYTEMRADCTAHATVDGIWKSLNELWRAADTYGNGDPICIGVIGGGQSRISQQFPAQDSIRLTALSFIFASRAQKVCQQLNIIVREDDVAKLDMLELQAFLRSLRPS
jgi:hypothetical protein